MDTMGRPGLGRFKNRFPGLSLKQKMRWISGLAAAVVVLSIAGTLAVSSLGLLGFEKILDNNSRGLNLWKAAGEEMRTFETYAADRTEKSRAAYEAARDRTEEAVAQLPFDYQKIGPKRYARTWSIRNLYENYRERRDRFLAAPRGGEGYFEELYALNRAQTYLQSYAGDLEFLTVEDGTRRYETLRPLFALIPGAAVLFGAAAVAGVRRLNRTADQNLVRPVVELARDSARIAAGDFDGPMVKALGEDEIAQLIRAFYHMKGATRGYIAALKDKHEAEKQLDAVRLQMLKNQINPHFLFNTLNMIASMAQVEDAATTEQMITAMSRLFRYNLKSTDSVMPLERELKVVSDYMYLQQMRFGKRLRFTSDCPDDTLDHLVPSFALQPLVENAIVHGISAQKEGGKIHIRARRADGRLWLWVSDTGCGMAEERLAQIRGALAAGDEKATGVGLGNIYRRIHAMYPDGEMEVFSRAGCGTVIRLAVGVGR